MSSLRTDPPLAASEVDTLRAYLDYHRDTLRIKTEGLGQEQLARRHPPSELTLAGLLKHAALNEDWWFMRVLEGRESEPDWVPAGAFDHDQDWELTSAAADDPDEQRRIFDTSRSDANAAIDRALGKNGLDTASVRTSRREQGQAFTLRWTLLHMIEEYHVTTDTQTSSAKRSTAPSVSDRLARRTLRSDLALPSATAKPA